MLRQVGSATLQLVQELVTIRLEHVLRRAADHQLVQALQVLLTRRTLQALVRERHIFSAPSDRIRQEQALVRC